MDKPRLRPVQAFPVDYEGKRRYGIRDPQNLATGPLVLEPHIFFILSLMDGTNSLLDIQTAFMRKFGQLLFSENLEKLLEDLDKNRYLESETFYRYLGELKEEFRRAEVRMASHAGAAYAGEPEALKKQLDALFEALDDGEASPSKNKGRLAGLVAPHIDLHRGGPCFARSYKTLEDSKAGIFIILGTAHSARKEPYILTDKDFQTPFGRMPADREFIQRLRDRCGDDRNEEEFLHRGEHSIEFQVLFLQYMLGADSGARIVPILCGPFLESFQKGISPWEIPRVRSFLEALREELDASKDQWCIVAGADLAHVGPQFGAPQPLTQADLVRLEKEDRAMLALIEKGDEEGFSRNILQDKDSRNVCGYPPIYALLKLMDGASGELLQYAHTADPNGTVSFAGVAFYR
jgi:AmmeMemoRadiSam system protein B